MRLIAFLLSFALLGCTQFPELDSAVTSRAQDAEYPALVPVQPLLAQTATSQPPPAQIHASISSRITALKARAAQLHRPVVDAKTRIRMANAVN